MKIDKLSMLLILICAILFQSSCSAATVLPTATTVPLTPTPIQPGLLIKPGSILGKVDIGGRNLHVVCLGAGSPTVILESGWGGDSSGWSPLMMEVSKYTRACAYDRAGLGESDPLPQKPRTSQDMVDDLHALLTKAPIPGPYILVGHSLGGFNIRLYATKYREEVVGMVSIEGVPVDQFVQCDLPTQSPGEDPSFVQAREDCQAVKAAFLDWTDNPEFLDYFASEEQVRATGSFGDLPLVVLVADDSIFGLPGTAYEFQGAICDQQEQEIAALSSNGQYKVIEQANHVSILEKPDTFDVVIQMVLSLQSE